MDLGLVLVCYFDRSWEQALDAVVAQGLRYVEPCGGGHIPKVHYDPQRLAADSEALAEFRESITSRGLEICALATHGNPVHPDPDRARAHHDDFVASCRVAAELGVGVVDVISGCPGGSPTDRSPNWIINSIYPDFKNAYEWQWNERLIPHWKAAAEIAESYGVRISVEPHGGDSVYNLQTFLRLRDAIGPTIGANVDPSHLFWMGIDVMQFIDRLGDAIIFAHAKDVSIDENVVRRDGLVPGTDFDDWENKSWAYRAIGFGHSELFWRDYVIALRRAGYDGAVAIEIEEPYLTTDDAVTLSVELMRRVTPRQGPPEGNWFDKYDWEVAEVE
jgi:sugar phosphate isomerase/epimerase